MLVLTRKRDEEIVLQVEEQTVRIRVVAVDGGRVRLGIDAGQDVKIIRSELLHEGVAAR